MYLSINILLTKIDLIVKSTSNEILWCLVMNMNKKKKNTISLILSP